MRAVVLSALAVLAWGPTARAAVSILPSPPAAAATILGQDGANPVSSTNPLPSLDANSAANLAADQAAAANTAAALTAQQQGASLFAAQSAVAGQTYYSPVSTSTTGGTYALSCLMPTPASWSILLQDQDPSGTWEYVQDASGANIGCTASATIGSIVIPSNTSYRSVLTGGTASITGVYASLSQTGR